MARAKGRACIDYGFHLMVREVDDRVLGEMDALVDEGVTSFKLFMAYPGVYMVDDAAIFRVLDRATGNGALTVLHAENGGLIDLLVARNLARGRTAPLWHGLSRPASLEGEATARAIALAEVAGAPVHIAHLSAAPALEAVHRARERGVAASAETCPQYLYLSLDDLDRPGFEGAKYVCSPPLRPRRHQHALWEGLRFGDLVATAPAKLFGLYPRKGTIAPGSDADIVVFDPGVERTLQAATHHMNVDYSCYEGMRVRGAPELVMQRGQVLVEGGGFKGRPGAGRFLPRSRPAAPSP